MGSIKIKINVGEKGELYKSVLNEIINNIPKSKLADLIIENWGIDEAREFGNSLIFSSILMKEPKQND